MGKVPQGLLGSVIAWLKLACENGIDARYEDGTPSANAKQIRTLINDLRAAAAREDAERVKREGIPGVMHPVNKSFYELTVKQRDAAWRECELLTARAAAAEAALGEHNEWRQKISALLQNGGMNEWAFIYGQISACIEISERRGTKLAETEAALGRERERVAQMLDQMARLLDQTAAPVSADAIREAAASVRSMRAAAPAAAEGE